MLNNRPTATDRGGLLFSIYSMKKKKIDLSKKLMLNKEAIAQLNVDQQFQLQGGAAATVATTCTTDTKQISSCRATSPAPGRPCCMIP